MFVLQFTAIYSAAVMNKLLKSFAKVDSILVFDLEDTLYDVDRVDTQSVKKWGRLQLIELSEICHEMSRIKKIGVRLNHPQSENFIGDVEMLSNLQLNWDIEAIVLPKIGNARELKEALFYLKSQKIAFRKCFLIVETIEGMKNLAQIADQAGIDGIIYGHNDYSLQLGHWPFLEQTEADFWSIVHPFIQIVEKAGLRYIHPPLSQISNKEIFRQILCRLMEKCSLSFGFMTINAEQTALIAEIEKRALTKEPIFENLIYSSEEKRRIAEEIVNLYSKKRARFLIDPKTKRSVTPHLYQAALLFLKEQNA